MSFLLSIIIAIILGMDNGTIPIEYKYIAISIILAGGLSGLKHD
jgi:hypothetical protein